jgi:hypothetical protein
MTLSPEIERFVHLGWGFVANDWMGLECELPVDMETDGEVKSRGSDIQAI